MVSPQIVFYRLFLMLLATACCWLLGLPKAARSMCVVGLPSCAPCAPCRPRRFVCAVARGTAGCVPFSEDACRAAAISLGLSLGDGSDTFTGDYTVKGCYAYSSRTHANSAYYGTGGATAQNMASVDMSGWTE